MAEKASQRASCVSASSSDCNSCFAACTGSKSSATRASSVVNAALKSLGSSDKANVAEASPTSMPTSGNLPVDLRKSNSRSWRSACSFRLTPEARPSKYASHVSATFHNVPTPTPRPAPSRLTAFSLKRTSSSTSLCKAATSLRSSSNCFSLLGRGNSETVSSYVTFSMPMESCNVFFVRTSRRLTSSPSSPVVCSSVLSRDASGDFWVSSLGCRSTTSTLLRPRLARTSPSSVRRRTQPLTTPSTVPLTPACLPVLTRTCDPAMTSEGSDSTSSDGDATHLRYEASPADLATTLSILTRDEDNWWRQRHWSLPCDSSRTSSTFCNSIWHPYLARQVLFSALTPHVVMTLLLPVRNRSSKSLLRPASFAGTLTSCDDPGINGPSNTYKGTASSLSKSPGTQSFGSTHTALSSFGAAKGDAAAGSWGLAARRVVGRVGCGRPLRWATGAQPLTAATSISSDAYLDALSPVIVETQPRRASRQGAAQWGLGRAYRSRVLRRCSLGGVC